MQTIVVNKRNSSFDVYIGRPSIFGNPFVIGMDGDRKQVIAKFRRYFFHRIESDPVYKKAVLGLRGKILGCFCAPLPCHGDVYAEYCDNYENIEKAKKESANGN